jgi:hypothetical protein
VLFLNANGTVKASQKLAHNTGGGPNLANGDNFGTSIASLGDLDGDGVLDLAVGAEVDDTGGTNRGAVHVLFLSPTTKPVIISPNTFSVAENSTAVGMVTALDADVPPQTLTFSIVGGADQARFTITSGGALSFLAPPDFEAPTDADGNNTYVVNVQVDDSEGGTDTATITVTVTNTSEPPGDYNGDGVVNAADYTVWRDTRGATVPILTGADGNGSGIVEQGDYSVWTAHFGESIASAGQAAGNDLAHSAQSAQPPLALVADGDLPVRIEQRVRRKIGIESALSPPDFAPLSNKSLLMLSPLPSADEEQVPRYVTSSSQPVSTNSQNLLAVDLAFATLDQLEVGE